jgi:hypothetical protein
VTPDDLDDYLRSIGLTVEVLTGADDLSYTVVRNFAIPSGSLVGRGCDVAIQRPLGDPYVLPSAIHTRPALLEMGTFNTQQSPIGPEWQYWSRRMDAPPSTRLIWAHVISALTEH